MPKYLFSNDQRISALVERIQWVANYILSGKEIKNISDKSDNNNAATLEFYYNLYPDTENVRVAITSPQEVIRNFVLKFQFPNTRTSDSFHDSLSDGVYLAPYRMVVSLLASLAKLKQENISYLTLNEILYFVFTDSEVCKNPSVNCEKIALSILENRKKQLDYTILISSNLIWRQYDRQVREMMSVLCKSCDSFKLSKGVLTFSKHEDDKDFIDKLIGYTYFWIPTDENNFELSNKEYSSYMNMAETPYNVVEFSKEKNNKIKENLGDYPLQQIYYGAPGTGKSYEINDITKSYSTIRTTFHPDSDYSTFVGAYKPTMEETEVQVVPVVTTNGISLEQNKGTYKEKHITYQYVKQAFLKAYLSAWQKYSEGGETTEPQFLIIEEINRGNCAQIFGDLFQLLDRSDDGFSTYPIEADTDLQNEISKAFGEGGEYALAEGFDIDGVVPGYDNITQAVKEGTVLLLPNNLYIWATMNTSDQSLFPIDSAFKRRWDWKYVKIADAHKDWTIRCGNEYCDWWTFISEINKKIAKETSSDDKKLGYFFCKPKKGETTINENKFVGKVLFYLWNDVFKDGDTSLFKVSDNDEDEVTFEAFYSDNGTVNVAAIRKFLVAVVGENNIKTEKGTDSDLVLDDGIDYTKYSFDGEPRLSKKDLGYKIVMKYINEHSDEPFAQLQSELAFDDSVANKYRYKGVLAKAEDIDGSYKPCFGEEQTSSDGVKYKVLTWWNKYNIDFIINFAKKQGWTVDKVTE